MMVFPDSLTPLNLKLLVPNVYLAAPPEFSSSTVSTTIHTTAKATWMPSANLADAIAWIYLESTITALLLLM